MNLKKIINMFIDIYIGPKSNKHLLVALSTLLTWFYFAMLKSNLCNNKLKTIFIIENINCQYGSMALSRGKVIAKRNFVR